MNELKDTIEIMIRSYNDKIRQSRSHTEIQYYSSKLEFLNDFRLVIYANENINNFIEDMK